MMLRIIPTQDHAGPSILTHTPAALWGGPKISRTSSLPTSATEDGRNSLRHCLRDFNPIATIALATHDHEIP